MNKRDIIISLLLGLIVSVCMITIRVALKQELPENLRLVLENTRFFIVIPIITFTYVYFLLLFGKQRKTFVQFGKFLLVGLSNFSIDFALLNVLMFLTDIDKGVLYSFFKGFSFLVAVGNSFFWNRIWTFQINGGENLQGQFLKFLGVALTGLLINVIVASVIVNFIEPGFISPRLWANVAALISVLAVLIWDFTGYKLLVFKK